MKFSPEIFTSLFASLPFFALSIAFFTVAVMCLVAIVLTPFSGAFQDKDGSVRNRKPMVGVLAISSVLLIGLGFLSIAGFAGALSDVSEIAANIEVDS